jgi:hypothetical protein
MIEDLAGRLVAQFADNLRAELAEGPDGAGAVAPAQASPGAPAPAGEAEAGARPAAVAAAAEGPSAIQAAPEPARPALSGEEAAPRAAPPSGGREAAPISGLRLTLWLVWRQVLRLFSGRR